MKVEIWSDIACPWCYVGKRRFERALGSFSHRDDVEIIWRSFELDPNAERTYAGTQAERLATKYRVPLAKAHAMNANMTAQGKTEGLDFDFDTAQSGNTFDAHRLIHFAATEGRRDAMVERLFRAYFTEGEAIGKRDVLVRLASEIGLDGEAVRTALDGTAFTDDVRADEERARSFEISGVPFFAIDERYGVSGAQPPEVLLDALRQAWDDAAPAAPPISDATEECDDGSCTI